MLCAVSYALVMSSAALETTENPIEYRNFSNLEGFITYRIARLHAALDRQAVQILKKVCGLRQSEWKVLLVLGGGAAPTSTDIARLTRLDPAIISRTLRNLENDGLLVTERSKVDRRTVNLTLSERGWATFETTALHMQARQRALLASLTQEETELAWKIFDKLEIAAEQREFEF